MSSQMRQINFSCTQIIKWYLSRALVKRSILECTPLVALLAIVGIVSDTSYMLSAFADKDPEDYDDIEDLSKDIDDGDTDDNSVDWDDFKKSQAFKTADDEIQECVEAEELGDNLGDYEILDCVDEYD
jgi:inorganic pyrophosphatase/exopolyphosphatase